jgi:hypothetical protein
MYHAPPGKYLFRSQVACPVKAIVVRDMMRRSMEEKRVVRWGMVDDIMKNERGMRSR